LKISSFFKNLNEIIDRYFPDRQLYFRANGDVRFVTISKRTQVLLSTAFVFFVIWCSFITYNYVWLDNILSDKNSEVAEANRNYEKIEAQFSELQNEVAKSAAALEQRQQYIQQVLEEDGETIPAVEVIEEELSDQVTPDYNDVDDSGKDQEARNNIRDQSLDQIYVDLKRIENHQNQLVSQLNFKMDQKLTFLSDTLSEAGIVQEKMLELANLTLSTSAAGGPFIEATAINAANLDNNSFDALYLKRANLNEIATALDHLPIVTPPEKHYVSSRFGVRRDPITKKWATHKGLDMAGWRDTPIKAGGAGVVTVAGRNGAFGLFIEINHGNGFKTKYGHLSKLKVKRGDKVEANQLIALMGSTGRSTSTHLHYEIWFNGQPIDPLKVIKAAKDVQQIKEQRNQQRNDA
jgi:murein DD-endopeptidase MepM/ murein hydrolase activator NlpD